MQNQSCIDTDAPWFCFSCLIDIADSVDNDSEIESNPHDVNTLHGLNQICSVCSLDSAVAGGEHVCTICKKAVHARYSNHEEISSSSQLICHYCSTD